MDYSEADLFLATELQAAFDADLRLQEKANDGIKSKNDVIRKKNMIRPEQEKLSISLNDPSWELIDPNPNIYTLFQIFNKQFFWGDLASVVVDWSKTMTLCAGLCRYEGRAGMCSVRLSAPLLKLRPRKDLIDTLLHEMIHAYLFVTHNNKDRTGHGPNFHEHMYRINKIAGTSITVYHTFHNEVALYQQHIWKCDGPCQHRHPYYGHIKRSINRAPSKHDPWFAEHQSSCGGTFIKIKEPENYNSKKRKLVTTSSKTPATGDIRKFLKKTDTKSGKVSPTTAMGAVSNAGDVGVSSVKVRGASSANVHKIDTVTGNAGRPDGSNLSKKPVRSSGTNAKKPSGSVASVRKPTSRTVSVGTSGTSLSTNATSSSAGAEASNSTASQMGRPSKTGVHPTGAVTDQANNSAPFVPFSGSGKTLDKAPRKITAVAPKNVATARSISPKPSDNSVIIIDDDEDYSWMSLVEEPTAEELAIIESKSLFPCPFCQRKFPSADINKHAETHF